MHAVGSGLCALCHIVVGRQRLLPAGISCQSVGTAPGRRKLLVTFVTDKLMWGHAG